MRKALFAIHAVVPQDPADENYDVVRKYFEAIFAEVHLDLK
jgi:hypothetical protein